MSDGPALDMWTMGDGQLRVGIEDQGWQVVAHVEGDADVATVDHLYESIGLYLVPGQRVVLDLSGVTFMDTSGLAVLEHAHTTLSASGGSLILRNPSSWAHRLLSTAGVDKRFVVEIG
jgi:anti-sigma B factor antagonist